MAVTLQAALTQHGITNIDELGTRNWTYLSYDATQGWDIVKFEGICGFFQQFFRWLFGCYASTHLKTIVNRVECEIVDVPSQLLARIRASWVRQGNEAINARFDVSTSSWWIGDTRYCIQPSDIGRLQVLIRGRVAQQEETINQSNLTASAWWIMQQAQEA